MLLPEAAWGINLYRVSAWTRAIVVPMLNEAAGLPRLHERLDALALHLRSTFGLRTEVVYVDDGSTDDTLAVAARLPCKSIDVQVVSLSRNFGKEAASGYETLLYDTMLGDATLFTRSDNIEQAWTIVDPILKAWKSDPGGTLCHYNAGTWGPQEADDMIRRDRHRWHVIS